MHGEERPVRGSVAHAWLHAVKHTKTLRFDLNFSVLGGFCGSIGVKQGGSYECGPCSKVADLAYGSPVLVIEAISTPVQNLKLWARVRNATGGFGASFKELQGLRFSFSCAFFVFFGSPSLD